MLRFKGVQSVLCYNSWYASFLFVAFLMIMLINSLELMEIAYNHLWQLLMLPCIAIHPISLAIIDDGVMLYIAVCSATLSLIHLSVDTTGFQQNQPKSYIGIMWPCADWLPCPDEFAARLTLTRNIPKTGPSLRSTLGTCPFSKQIKG